MQNLDQNPKLTRLQRFFVVSSGTTLASYHKALPDDQQKRRNQGIVVVAVAAISGLLAGLAWSIPMGWPGYFVSIPWFLIMLLLERVVLQEMDTVAAIKLAKEWMKGNFNYEDEKRGSVGIGWLLLRFIMIFFICYFNSEMVRIVLFRPEIVAEIKIRQDAETAKVSEAIKSERDSINGLIASKELAVKDAQKELAFLIEGYDEKINALDDSLNFWNSKYIYEVKGPGGLTGKAGNGPVSEAITRSIDEFEWLRNQTTMQRDSARRYSVQAGNLLFAEDELNFARKRAKEEIAFVEEREKALIKEIMDRPVNGLAFMLSVLNDISGRNIIIWAVFAMFFFFEGIPVLLKFFSKNDSYITERALQYMEKIKDSNEQAKVIYESLIKHKSRQPAEALQ